MVTVLRLFDLKILNLKSVTITLMLLELHLCMGINATETVAS